MSIQIDNILSDQGIDILKNVFRTNVKEFNSFMQLYRSGIREIKTKLEILDDEFKVKYDHNPIHHIESRLKTPESLVEKIIKKNIEPSYKSIHDNINDIAGIRVICNYKNDVERVAEMLTKQDDVSVKYIRDYIKDPKENGYRSLHLVVEVPIYLAEEKIAVPVEIQIRTIAMDFWASLEHKLRYKSACSVSQDLKHRLKICAEAICEVDEEMQAIHNEINDSFDCN